MQSICLDTLSLENIKIKAQNDANVFCTKAKITPHQAVPIGGCCMSYINFRPDIEFLTFTINENPFGIYDKVDEKDLEKLKTVNYTFPISCVSSNVVTYFSEYVKYINDKFDFTSITGDTSYRNNKAGTSGHFNQVRPFFNLPPESKSENPSYIAHIRIEPDAFVNKVPPTNYNLIVKKLDGSMIKTIPNLRELMTLLVKRSTYKVYIKPVKLMSSYKHYENYYNISWKMFAIQELAVQVDQTNVLLSLLREPSPEQPRADAEQEPAGERASGFTFD